MDGERAPLDGFADDADMPSMSQRDMLHDRQSQTCAALLPTMVGIDLVEPLEDMRQMPRFHSATEILHKNPIFLFRFLLPAQNRFHTGSQHSRTEGFDDVIVCAEFQSDDDIRILTLCRQHDYLDFFGLSVTFQPTTNLKFIDAGQHQVEDQQVGAFFEALRRVSSPVCASTIS